MTARHFLDLSSVDAGVLRAILDRAAMMKRGDDLSLPMAGRSLAMIFEKPSTRTRVSFEVAVRQLGGHPVILSSKEMQLGRGETVADTAKVLSRYVDAIMIRTDSHEKLLELAHHATVPVINGLTDHSHPCQIMADVLTFEEHKGPIQGRKVAWTGDGNNVVHSFIHAAVRFDFSLDIACPEGLQPAAEVVHWAQQHQGRIRILRDPYEAVKDADAVVADTWVSMGQADADERHRALEPYRVDDRLMDAANQGAIFLHCLPAHRGEEVTAEVIDGPRSVVFDEAENRLHAQKAILAWCVEGMRA
ncbi:ornithine carbamoyltransferase [Geminicoccus roseus]|uniref:ornithine carbamoyltransferase n=1 Tax=Geminicoccus roseus TaxID=404900 RepID=UPI0003F94EE0|nr:ornithine carbamoyltransferase [Geminicoccus roseus]